MQKHDGLPVIDIRTERVEADSDYGPTTEAVIANAEDFIAMAVFEDLTEPAWKIKVHKKNWWPWSTQEMVQDKRHYKKALVDAWLPKEYMVRRGNELMWGHVQVQIRVFDNNKHMRWIDLLETSATNKLTLTNFDEIATLYTMPSWGNE